MSAVFGHPSRWAVWVWVLGRAAGLPGVGWVRRRRRGPDRAEVLGVLRAERADLDAAPREVLAAAEGAGVSRRTVWRWVRRHGARRLELALAAGLDEYEMRRHLADRTVPAEWALRELASGSGLDTSRADRA